jgi:Domain of unknown function (DUF5664)
MEGNTMTNESTTYAAATTFHPTNSTGAMRASGGVKIQVNLVPYELVAMAAIGLELGAVKYTPRNFEKGLNAVSTIESIKRHCEAYLAREDNDEDSGLPHEVLICSSVAIFAHNVMQGVIVDDRPEKKLGKTVAEIATNAQNVLQKALTKFGGKS